MTLPGLFQRIDGYLDRLPGDEEYGASLESLGTLLSDLPAEKQRVLERALLTAVLYYLHLEAYVECGDRSPAISAEQAYDSIETLNRLVREFSIPPKTLGLVAGVCLLLADAVIALDPDVAWAVDVDFHEWIGLGILFWQFLQPMLKLE